MHRFTLRQLEYFVACVDAGSIAGAAVSLNVSQPTVSVAITKLEDQLGMQLLLRHHAQGVSVTAGALRFVQSARSLLSHATDVQREAMMISDDIESDNISGVLRLGSFVTLAPSVLPGLISQFHQNYPGVKLDLQEGTQEKLVEGLCDGTSTAYDESSWATMAALDTEVLPMLQPLSTVSVNVGDCNL